MKHLGYRLRDTITGYEGIATGYTLYLFGSEQYLISPTGLNEDGELQEGYWINSGRLTVIDEGIVPSLNERFNKDINKQIESIINEESTEK